MTGSEFQTKLAKVCGMLGSAHAGERAAAALKATALLSEMGLTWNAFVSSKIILSGNRSRQEDSPATEMWKAKFELERETLERERKAWEKERAALLKAAGAMNALEIKPHAARAQKLLDSYFPAYLNENAARFLRDVAGWLARLDLSEKQAAYLAKLEAQCARMAGMAAKKKAAA